MKLLLDAKVPNQIAGAVGFSVRENKVYIIKAKTMSVACGGAVNVYRPRSTGEGLGRAWYPFGTPVPPTPCVLRSAPK